MTKLRRSWFYVVFLVVLLTTEFFYIDVGGGVARIYHFAAVIFGLFGLRSVFQLCRSSVFIALLMFAAVNVLTALMSENRAAALASSLSNDANLFVVVVVATALVRGYVTISRLSRIVLILTNVSVLLGILQIVAVKAGVLLALSDTQVAQIQLGFGPGFRTEANTFGKYMVLPALLFLPRLVSAQASRRLWVSYSMIILGVLMNFTRTSLYGIAAALAFAAVWYVAKGHIERTAKRLLLVGVSVCVGCALVVADVVPLSDYARYKMENFFNQEEILEGGSSAYRLEVMQVALDNTMRDAKHIAFGSGWGQTRYVISGQEVQAGGGDLVNVFAYSGLMGVIAYLTYTGAAFASALRIARRRDRTPETLFAEGVVFACIGMFCTGQLSGYLIAPEYYLLLGVCVYLSLRRNRSPEPARLPV